MKKNLVIALVAALTLSIAACSMEPSDSALPDAGSVSGSVQTSSVEPAAVEPEEPEIEIPEYDPVELDFNNPLADVDIASVEFRLYGVDSQELEAADAQTILDIAQNDGRTFDMYIDDGPGWTTDNGKESAGPRFILLLESGEELVLTAVRQDGYKASFYINNYRYELTDEEYESFAALYDGCYEDMVDNTEGTLTPFADLTANDLIKITRFNYYYYDYDGEYPMPEQVLTDEQVDMVLSTLNTLEIDPATAENKLDMLYGGGYGKFELWFKDGSHFVVGSHSKTVFDDSGSQFLGSVPVAYIDGVLFECDREFVDSLYWDYEETDMDYVPWYLSARDVPEYPFEELTVDEIGQATIGLEDDGIGTSGIVPRSLNDDIVDVLRQIKYSDENKMEVDDSTFMGTYESGTTMTLYLTNGEYVYLGLEDDCAVINFGRYSQDRDVIDAIEDLFDDAVKAHKDMIESAGDTFEVAVRGADTASQYDPETDTLKPFVEYSYFELPDILVEHDDGYYPEGYSLEDAPLSVQINSYKSFIGDDNNDHASLYDELMDEMEAADGVGYSKSSVTRTFGSGWLIDHWDEDGSVSVAYVSGGYLSRCEVLIKGDADFEVTPEAVYLLVSDTMRTENVFE